MAFPTPGFPAALDSAATLGDSANFAATTLDGAHNNSITTITVASTTLFPATGVVVIGSEVIFYTGKTGTTFTGCTRGADDSTAASHSSGDSVYGYIVAAYQHALRAAIIALENKLGTGASVPTTVGHVLTVTGAGATAFQAPAGGGSSDVVKIATLSGAGADFDLTSIPGTYAALRVQGTVRCNTDGGYLLMQVNGDTGSNYESQSFYATGGSLAASSSTDAFVNVGDLAPNGGGAANTASHFSVDIYNYAGTTFHKMIASDNDMVDGSSGPRIFRRGTRWKSAAAITRLRFYPSSGNFVAGSAITLWGLKG